MRPVNATGPVESVRTVQQERTATDRDAGGLPGMREDGDLRGRTAVDALPADGMQEVWGSNPHSSTRNLCSSESC